MREPWTLDTVAAWAARLHGTGHMAPDDVQALGGCLAFLLDYQAETDTQIARLSTEAETFSTTVHGLAAQIDALCREVDGLQETIHALVSELHAVQGGSWEEAPDA